MWPSRLAVAVGTWCQSRSGVGVRSVWPTSSVVGVWQPASMLIPSPLASGVHLQCWSPPPLRQPRACCFRWRDAYMHGWRKERFGAGKCQAWGLAWEQARVYALAQTLSRTSRPRGQRQATVVWQTLPNTLCCPATKARSATSAHRVETREGTKRTQRQRRIICARRWGPPATTTRMRW